MGTEEHVESAELSIGPTGIGGKITNPTARSVYVLLCGLIVAVTGAGFYLSNAKADERQAQQLAAQMEVKAALLKYEETQRALIYVMALPQGQREALNLQKPRVLRDMQQ